MCDRCSQSLLAPHRADAQAGADEKSPAIRNAEKMVELMSTSPQLQEMMLAVRSAFLPYEAMQMLWPTLLMHNTMANGVHISFGQACFTLLSI